MKKILALILAVLMVASCFAGCSKGETITIGYTENSPFTYTDETGALTGFDVELAKAVFEGMGYSVSFTEVDDETLYSDLDTGNIDCIWSGFNSLAAGESIATISLTHEYAVNENEGISYTVAFTLGSDLIDKVNNQLKKQSEEGKIAELAEKYELTKTHNITPVTDYSDLGTASGSNQIFVGYTVKEPFNYTDEEDNLVGFDTELAKAVFEGLGYVVTFKEITWDTKYTTLDSDKIDCIWNGFASNGVDADGVASAERVVFSYNYMESRQVVVVKKDSGIAGAADLADKTGCAWAGSAGEEYLLTLGCAMPYGLDSQTECLDAVKDGTYDCNFAVVDEYLAKSYCAENTDLEILSGLSGEPSYFAVGLNKTKNKSADEEALIHKVNAQLEKLAADGTIAELAEKYGLSGSVITDFADQKK